MQISMKIKREWTYLVLQVLCVYKQIHAWHFSQRHEHKHIPAEQFTRTVVHTVWFWVCIKGYVTVCVLWRKTVKCSILDVTRSKIYLIQSRLTVRAVIDPIAVKLMAAFILVNLNLVSNDGWISRINIKSILLYKYNEFYSVYQSCKSIKFNVLNFMYQPYREVRCNVI